MASKGSGIRVVVFDEQDRITPAVRHAMIEAVESFYDLSPFASFIEQNANDGRAIVIVTTSTDDDTLQAMEDLYPVDAILIFSSKERDINTLPSKIVGVYSQTESLIRALFETLDVLELQLNANSILFHRRKDGSDNIDFYFYYLWQTYNVNQIVTKNVLIDQARVMFRTEPHIKPFLHDFNTNYKPKEVLQWLDKYNYPFPYHLLITNALRTHDQQLLSLVRSFILDLTKQMKTIPAGPGYNQVYFGAKLPIAIVDRLEQQTSNDIVAFQCFLPTTRSRAQALAAATRPTRRRKVANVLFKIDISNALCAFLKDQILVNMATPFHVTCVARNTGSGGVQQLVTIVTLVALDKPNRDYLLGYFTQKQKKDGKSIYDFVHRTILPAR
jgi:hypothetical protein